MTTRESDGERRIGSVKAAINMYGGTMLRNSSASKKRQIDSAESSLVATELHKSRREINLYKENRKSAESAKAQAESELSNAKQTVKELSLMIEESNSKVKAEKRHIETLSNSRMQREKALETRNSEDSKYMEVMRELELVKQDLSKLKLDIASALEEKSRAEKEIEDSGLKMESYLRSAEGLKREMAVVNEEHVLVELARIEALKEYGEIQAQREKKASQFLVPLAERRNKIKEMMEEIEKSKEIENKLSFTLSDVNMLETQLKLVKEMEQRVQRNNSLARSKENFQREDSNLLVLKEITEEIEAKKKELSFINAEGFQFMSSMDAIRKELIKIQDEITRLNKIDEKADVKIQSLNSKLLRAKSKLEAVSAAEEKATSIATNLDINLQQLKTNTEAAKKEKLLVEEEISSTKTEMCKTESEIDEKEEKLFSKLLELEQIKYSEVLALDNLESVIENTMQARALVSQHSSTITISRYEYEYLTGHAFQAKEVADKKVAAARAWVEALKFSEKEILMKTEVFRRESGKTKVEEEREVFRTERSLSTKRMVEKEIQKWKQKNEKDLEAKNYSSGRPMRKSLKGSGKSNQTPRGKFRKSFSPATRVTPTYFVIKKRRKVPNLVKFFSGKR